MNREQIVMGVLIALVGLAGIIKREWLLTRTGKGESLVNRFGTETARNVIAIAFGALLLLGICLATGIVNPIRW